MLRRFFTLILAAISVAAVASEPADAPLLSKPQFSGYALLQYQATLKDGANSNSFNLRMARVSLGGRILGDFEYKLQGQINGNTSTLGSSPRLVDAYVEWQKYGFARIKVGQFKRPFTFENPMNPIDQGFMSYAQAVTRLSGFNDRSGEHASNGRDIGVQVQGSLLPNAAGRPLVHYQVGLFNGQGINTSDVDNRKDVIGGLWIAPVDGLRIGAFGWIGSHARRGHWTDADGHEHQGTVSLAQYRYALSAEYKMGDWQLRSEFIHSTGYGFAQSAQSDADRADATVNTALGNKADGLYALCIAPLIKQRLRIKARYDLYRRSASWADSRTQYEIGLNWLLHRNLELQAEYAFVNDRTQATHNSSIVDIELCVRF